MRLTKCGLPSAPMTKADFPTRDSMRCGPSAVATSVSPVTHGLLALMRPSVWQVCHSLIVVSNCTPGSAHCHAATAIASHNSAAGSDLATAPSVRRINSHDASDSSARMKSFERRTELFEFCPETVLYPSPSQLTSYVSIASDVYPCFAKSSAY